NHFLDLVHNGRFHDIERTIDQDLYCLTWRLGASGDAQGGLVKYIVHTVDSLVDHFFVADVTFNHSDAGLFERPREIAPTSAHEVVDDPHLGRACVDELINDGAPNESSPAGHAATCAFQFVHFSPRKGFILLSDHEL